MTMTPERIKQLTTLVEQVQDPAQFDDLSQMTFALTCELVELNDIFNQRPDPLSDAHVDSTPVGRAHIIQSIAELEEAGFDQLGSRLTWVRTIR